MSRPRAIPTTRSAKQVADLPFACLEPLEPRVLLSASGNHLQEPPAPSAADAAVHVQANHDQQVRQRGKVQLAEFDADNFDEPVANEYYPLVPGTTYVYEGEEEDGVITSTIMVTADTKVILGVTTTVVKETEEIYIEELDQTFVLEATFDWLAYDNYGNVWYFGEDTTSYEYDDDWNLIETTNEGAWEAGVDGAEPGILVFGNPLPGAGTQQEIAADIAEDRARVLRTNATVSLDIGTFENVLVTKEWNPLEPGSVEKKYYAPGVGLIYVEELSGGKTVVYELISITMV